MAADTRMNEEQQAALEAEIKASLANGRLPCPVAFRIAEKYGVSRKHIGDTTNKIEVKISSCQLGCFS